MEFVKLNKIKNVDFLGNVTGDDLIQAFTSADVYVLPSHSEGMPTTVLEAMAFGLPIVSRPVGGLKDFFQENIMGYLIEGLEPKDYAVKLESLLNDKETCKLIGEYNHEYAKSKFMASNVALDMEAIFKKVQ